MGFVFPRDRMTNRANPRQMRRARCRTDGARVRDVSSNRLTILKTDKPLITYASTHACIRLPVRGARGKTTSRPTLRHTTHTGRLTDHSGQPTKPQRVHGRKPIGLPIAKAGSNSHRRRIRCPKANIRDRTNRQVCGNIFHAVRQQAVRPSAPGLLVT